MQLEFDDTKQSLYSALTNAINRIDGDTITLRRLLTLVGEHGLLFLCALLSLPFMIPVSIPGVSTVFGAAIILLAIGITVNRLPWLPDRIMDRELNAEKLKGILQRGANIVGRVEEYVKPRYKTLTGTASANRLNGLAIVLGGVLLMAPLGFLPFSNTLPAFAILLLAVGMAQRDGLVVLAGYAMNLATIIYFGALAYLAFVAGRGLAGVLG